MKKRFFSGALALCLGLSLFPAAAFATEGAPASGAAYYSDVTDIIGPITPPAPEPEVPGEQAGGDVVVPNTDAFSSNEEFKPYDPYYPKREQHGDYFFHVPALKGRLTFSVGDNGKLKGTLYAPGVSRASGWQDATKQWGQVDSGLCFAASTSNLISWYLNQYVQQHPNEPHDFERNVERIFDHYRKVWDPSQGGSQMEALSWYFTGAFPNGTNQPNNNHLNTTTEGGYLRHKIPNNDSERWSDVSTFQWKPETIYTAFGSTENNHFPFMDDVSGMTGSGAFASLESFSEQVIRQLHYGACTISIVADSGMGGSGHAITLWGVDYDVESGLVTAIHVTDSDDTRGIFSVKVLRGDSNGGVRMESYPYHTPNGGTQKFTRIRDSIVLYSPEVVQTTPQPIPPEEITSDKYPINDQKEISGIQPNASLDSIRNDLTGKNIQVFDAQGNPVAANTPLGTGYVLTTGDIASGLTVVVSGDVNGDAQVNTDDVARLQKVLTKQETLEGIYQKAAVFQSKSEAGPTVQDLFALKQFVLGIKGSL